MRTRCRERSLQPRAFSGKVASPGAGSATPSSSTMLEPGSGNRGSSTTLLPTGGWRAVRLWETEVLADAERCVGTILNSQPAGALSVAPRKTFAGSGPMGGALEKHGWTAAGATDVVTLSRGDLKLMTRMERPRPP